MFKILYGDSNPFENISPTPMVEREINSVFYAKKHGETESYSLRGVVTGNFCLDGNEFSGLWSRANQLVSNFSQPFQRFQILEDLGTASGILFANGHALVRSIDFEDSVYAGILPYTVSIDVFKEGSFTNYGIMEPSQQTSFEQGENGDVSISKSTKARGFNTDSPAIENAISFVQNITGLDALLTPAFIPPSGLASSVLVSLDEKINRLEGTYEVSEGWIYNHYGNMGDHSIYEKTVAIDSGEDGIKVSINGKIKGGIGTSFTSLRDDFANIDFFGIAESVYEANASGDLYVRPLSKQVTENSLDRSVDFSFVYSDKITEDPYIIDSISVNYDHLNNKICADASITVKSTDFCPTSRWTKVKNYADAFSIVTWMDTRLSSLGYNLNLPTKPNNSSISYNEQAGVISITASICDKKIIIPAHCDDFNYTVSVTPAMPTFVPFQGLDCGGAFTVQKLTGLKRRTLGIQGNAQVSSCSTYEQAKASVLEYINNLKFTYLDGSDIFLSQHNVQRGTGEARNRFTFSFSWNESADTVFSNSQLHSTLE